jgi:SAM-dependent methyltransferase
VRGLPAGKYLEIGFGTGVCAYEFFLLGHACTGYELDNRSIEITNALFNSENGIVIDIREQLNEQDLSQYDYVAAFEVLEHIEDDLSMLVDISRYLKGNGRLILSVPAHQKKFSYLDKVSGHIRRYEKKELLQKLDQSGFIIDSILCYGFPFSNIFSLPFNLLYRKKQYESVKHLSEQEKTLASGYLRVSDYKFKKLIPYWFVYMFSIVQRVFYKTDLGLGYVVVAQKRCVK